MTNSREMRALDPALLERVRNCARQVADHIDEFGHAFDEDLHFLDKALTDYGLAISAPHAQGDVTGLVEAIREERRAYITDDYDHMALVDAFNKGLDAAIAALRQAPDAEQGVGWIEWNSTSDAPPDDLIPMVDVLYRNGSAEVGRADGFSWSQGDDAEDIVAYRRVGRAALKQGEPM